MVCDKVDSAYEAKLCVGYLSLAFSYCGRRDDLFGKKCGMICFPHYDTNTLKAQAHAIASNGKASMEDLEDFSVDDLNDLKLDDDDLSLN